MRRYRLQPQEALLVLGADAADTLGDLPVALLPGVPALDVELAWQWFVGRTVLALVVLGGHHVAMIDEESGPAASLCQHELQDSEALEAPATGLFLGQTQHVDVGGVGPVGVAGALFAPDHGVEAQVSADASHRSAAPGGQLQGRAAQALVQALELNSTLLAPRDQLSRRTCLELGDPSAPEAQSDVGLARLDDQVRLHQPQEPLGEGVSRLPLPAISVRPDPPAEAVADPLEHASMVVGDDDREVMADRSFVTE